MKRLICLLLAVLLLLCGCAGEKQKDSQQILQTRRDAVEAHMRQMMSVLWQSDTDIVYSTLVNSLGVDMDEESRLIRLKAGQIYSGMPYTHGSSGAENFLHFGQQDANGVYQMSGLTTDLLSGAGGTKVDNRARLSNDCADAVFWAWARVGNSFYFTMTQNMTASRGCIPVGDYKTEESVYTRTRDIVKENGEDVMFKAYASLQKADAVVTFNNAGHAMLVAAVEVVQNGNTIDPEASYVLVHEQFTGNYGREESFEHETLGTVLQLGGVDRKYTFAQLFKKGYVPVTIQELVDPAPVQWLEIQDSVTEWDASSVTKGVLSTTSKMLSVTVLLENDQGETVQQATCFVQEAERMLFHMEKFEEPMEQAVMDGSLELDRLQPGSYRCLTTCTLGTGETVTVRDFVFTVGA